MIGWPAWLPAVKFNSCSNLLSSIHTDCTILHSVSLCIKKILLLLLLLSCRIVQHTVRAPQCNNNHRLFCFLFIMHLFITCCVVRHIQRTHLKMTLLKRVHTVVIRNWMILRLLWCYSEKVWSSLFSVTADTALLLEVVCLLLIRVSIYRCLFRHPFVCLVV